MQRNSQTKRIYHNRTQMSDHVKSNGMDGQDEQIFSFIN